jgi:menaquinone-specific isochorismate synthase
LVHDTKISPEIDSLVKDISACSFTAGQVPVVHRFELSLSSIDPLAWLWRQKFSQKIFFSSRDTSLKYAAVGSAHTLTDRDCLLDIALADISRNTADSNCRYFGGASFDPESPVDQQWQQFGKFTFVLPRIELIVNDDKTKLAVNCLVSPGDDPSGIGEELIADLRRIDMSDSNELPKTFPKAVSSVSVAPKEQWLKTSADIIETLNSGNIDKVVLARKQILEMPSKVDPLAIVSAIANEDIPTYDFCFQLDDSTAFIGSTPENLYRSDNSKLYTEAIAGTAITGDTAEQTARYCQQLCNSQKEQIEHEFVCDDIRDALSDICDSVSQGEQKVVQLKNLQHLFTEFTGDLKQGVCNYDILNALHPTAAVCGLPRKDAMDRIKSCESFSRGFYAGPVGYISARQSEFAVAIRSALISKNIVHLYAGAGLVAASAPAAEWNETQNKLQQFLDILT